MENTLRPEVAGVVPIVFTALAQCACEGDFRLRVNPGLKWRGCPSCMSPGFGWCRFFFLAPWLSGLFGTAASLRHFGGRLPRGNPNDATGSETRNAGESAGAGGVFVKTPGVRQGRA